MTVTNWFNRSALQDEIDPDSAPLTSIDLDRLSAVEASLARGLAIEKWWNTVNEDTGVPLDADSVQTLREANRLQEVFPLMQVAPHWPHDVSYGFFDKIGQDGSDLNVMGCVQQFFYDQPTLRLRDAASRVHEISPAVIERVNEQALNNWRDNLREFVHGVFINATSFVRPYPHVDVRQGPLASYLERFSWCAEGEVARAGIQHSQLYYKRSDTGHVGKFWPVEYRHINLREIGERYSWIVIEIEVSDSTLDLRLDDDSPYMSVPVMTRQFGVISPELVVADETRGGGTLGRYRFGYALLKQNGGSSGDVPPLYDVGLQQTEFRLEDDGEILIQNYLIAERPKRVSAVNINPAGIWISAVDRMSLGMFSNVLKPMAESFSRVPLVGQFDPVLAYLGVANAVTGGFAGKELCIRREQVERRLLFNHFVEQFETVLGTRGIWRHRRDWTRPVTAHGH